MITNPWMWLGFSIFLIVALSLDALFLKNRTRPSQSLRTAWAFTFLWISAAFIFNLILWIFLLATTEKHIANTTALNFLTGYLIEEMLSIDNLFAFYLIFHQFRIPLPYQQRIFSYGIWGAIVMRLTLILLGTWLVSRFHWLLYLMGAFLLLTGLKMLFAADDNQNLKQSRVFIWLKKHIRITDEIKSHHFFVRKEGPLPDKKKYLYATPLFIALILVELSDLIFAFDSIPAIFAITTDPFIVWTSNIFAILGLRSLYFVLSSMMDRFHLLKYGVSLILIFIGFKMMIEPWLVIPTAVSLGVVVVVLLIFSVLSWKESNANH